MNAIWLAIGIISCKRSACPFKPDLKKEAIVMGRHHCHNSPNANSVLPNI